MTLAPSALRQFEQDIATIFNRGDIHAPIHLAGGNEDQLIQYFNDNFRPGDWVASNWRSHYHALLAGVPADEVRAAILRGRSITLTFPTHNFISSAIVGGILSIAVGIALGLKRTKSGVGPDCGETAPELTHRAVTAGRDRQPIVHCFVGDMTARTGIYHEATEYARGHLLPISFVIEDNGKSVGTPTEEVWGIHAGLHVERHVHENPWPHAGSGEWIKF